MAQPTMLAFNFADARLDSLRKVCTRKHIRLIEVASADQAQTIASICGMTPKKESASADTPFADEVIVMVHFTPGGLNAFLQAWKQADQATIALKAMLTPTNMGWTACQLHAELLQEDAAMKQHDGSVHQA